MNRIRLLVLISLVVARWPEARAQAVQAYLDGQNVRIAAPQIHFISGRIMEKLHNGAAVPFTVELSAFGSGGRPISQVSERFVLSYDLWEERYSVVQQSARRSASGLSTAAAEAWCIENVSLPVSALAGQKSFVLKLDIHTADASGPEGSPGMSVAALVDVFSRKAREQPSHWSAASGSLRLADLKEKNRKSGTPSFPARRL